MIGVLNYTLTMRHKYFIEIIYIKYIYINLVF